MGTLADILESPEEKQTDWDSANGSRLWARPNIQESAWHDRNIVSETFMDNIYPEYNTTKMRMNDETIQRRVREKTISS